MFYWRSSLRQDGGGPSTVELGFTDRGQFLADSGPFEGHNLGGHVGDEPDRVEEHRRALASRLGVDRGRLLFMHQVHGSTVLDVTEPWRGEIAACDGIVTCTADLALAVLVADCVPVLLHDARAGVIGAVHAGRPGMVAGVVPAAVRRMRDLGATDIAAVVGPSVCGRCYEVPEAMMAEAAQVSPASVSRSWTGTPAIDVAAGVVDQLVTDGIAVQRIPGCTREDLSLYSYRRDRRTGRFAGVVMLRSGRDPA